MVADRFKLAVVFGLLASSLAAAGSTPVMTAWFSGCAELWGVPSAPGAQASSLTDSPSFLAAYLPEFAAQFLGNCFELNSTSNSTVFHAWVQVVGVVPCLSLPGTAGLCNPQENRFRVVIGNLTGATRPISDVCSNITFRAVSCEAAAASISSATADTVPTGRHPLNPAGALAPVNSTDNSTEVELPVTISSAGPQPGVSILSHRRTLLLRGLTQSNPDLPHQRSGSTPASTPSKSPSPATPTPAKSPASPSKQSSPSQSSPSPSSPQQQRSSPFRLPSTFSFRGFNLPIPFRRRLSQANPDLPNQRSGSTPQPQPTVSQTPAPVAQPVSTQTPVSTPAPQSSAPAAVVQQSAPQQQASSLNLPAGFSFPGFSLPAATSQTFTLATSISGSTIYDGGFASGWSDASSLGARPFTQYTPAGRTHGVADCKILPQGASLAVQTSSMGAFVSAHTLEFWAYKGSQSSIPSLDITLGSNAAGDTCKTVKLGSSGVAAESNGWVKYDIPLSQFDSRGASPAGGPLMGCSNQGSAVNIVKVSWTNPSSQYQALICLDSISLQ